VLVRAALALALLAALVFAGAEAWRRARSDDGRLWLAARFGWGDTADLTRIVSHRLRDGLAAAAVPRDSLRESVTPRGRAALRWRVGVPVSGSPTQINVALAQALARRGCTVLEGHERIGPHRELVVTLLVGLPRRPTHEVVLVRAARDERAPARDTARLALVLYGFGDDPEAAAAFFRLPAPFAVAVVPGARWSPAMLRAARAAQREIVLHVPLEPVNYPQVNPGPGTLLVTIPPARITGTLRRWLDQAGPVSAVANHMGSLATQDMAVMGAVYRELRRRGLPFVHLQPAAGAVCKALAAERGVAYEEPDVTLDAEARAADGRALERRWKDTLERARERGRLVVFVRATPRVRAWLPGALAPKRVEGVSVVPLASLLRRPAGG
jgi:polysaccharide deacetylase 2 family uncharacterized protein YibQ